jgi:hypothetical protein
MIPRGTAVFSSCGRYRYRLTRQWHVGDVSVCAWLMLNPSKADADHDDMTIAKASGFSQRWGFGGLVVVNMFGLVSTNPKIMLTDDDPVGPENDAHLRSVLRDTPAVGRIVCAWGNLPWRDNGKTTYWGRVDSWARELKRDRRAMCLGRTTTTGEPRHPSRLGYATEVEPFLARCAGKTRVIGVGGGDWQDYTPDSGPQ